jgi:microcystin-dependent protein
MINPKLLVEAFPINKVEVFFDDLDHSNFLGFSWERIAEGKFPVGYDPNDTDYNQIGKTGGEKMHKLTIDEMPKHSHKIKVSGSTTGGYAGILRNNASDGPASGFIENEGGNQSHENRPPFIVMALWRRIA